MNRRPIVFAVFLAMLSVVPCKAQDGKELLEPSYKDRQETNEQRKSDIACRCCRQCLEAKRQIQGKEEGPPAKNGCRDCCERCPIHFQDKRKMPPEIVR